MGMRLVRVSIPQIFLSTPNSYRKILTPHGNRWEPTVDLQFRFITRILFPHSKLPLEFPISEYVIIRNTGSGS